MNQIPIKQVVFLVLVTVLGILCSVIFNIPLLIGFLPGALPWDDSMECTCHYVQHDCGVTNL
jgi:hypothetical protein